MLDRAVLDRFVSRTAGQPRREGTRYAREARVTPFVGTGTSVSTVVRGRSDDYDVALWTEEDGLCWRCTCPSWRDPCKHVVAAAMVLRQDALGDEDVVLEEGSLDEVMAKAERRALSRADPALARAEALEERLLAARREPLAEPREGPGQLRVAGESVLA